MSRFGRKNRAHGYHVGKSSADAGLQRRCAHDVGKTAVELADASSDAAALCKSQRSGNDRRGPETRPDELGDARAHFHGGQDPSSGYSSSPMRYPGGMPDARRHETTNRPDQKHIGDVVVGTIVRFDTERTARFSDAVTEIMSPR